MWLCDEQRTGRVRNCYTETEEKPGGDKHPEVHADGLENDSKEHDKAS
jgi:hypothetical protein